MTDTFEQMAVRAYETAMGQELRQQDKASVLKCMAAFRDELAKISAPSDDREVYVECRQCDSCWHVGINDSDGKKAACHNCDWSGDSPVEDKCPGCGDENCMAAACPKCGCRYSLLAEETIDSAPADTVAKDSEIESLRAQLAAANAEVQEQARLNGMGAEREAKLRAQLDEEKAEVDKLTSLLSHWEKIIKKDREQLLATQAHAAHLFEVLRISQFDADSVCPLCRGHRKHNGCGIEVALSTPINLDALHEDRARTLEEAVKNWPDRPGSGRSTIDAAAAAHRAKKEGK